MGILAVELEEILSLILDLIDIVNSFIHQCDKFHCSKSKKRHRFCEQCMQSVCPVEDKMCEKIFCDELIHGSRKENVKSKAIFLSAASRRTQSVDSPYKLDTCFATLKGARRKRSFILETK